MSFGSCVAIKFKKKKRKEYSMKYSLENEFSEKREVTVLRYCLFEPFIEQLGFYCMNGLLGFSGLGYYSFGPYGSLGSTGHWAMAAQSSPGTTTPDRTGESPLGRWLTVADSSAHRRNSLTGRRSRLRKY